LEQEAAERKTKFEALKEAHNSDIAKMEDIIAQLLSEIAGLRQHLLQPYSECIKKCHEDLEKTKDKILESYGSSSTAISKDSSMDNFVKMITTVDLRSEVEGTCSDISGHFDSVFDGFPLKILDSTPEMEQLTKEKNILYSDLCCLFRTLPEVERCKICDDDIFVRELHCLECGHKYCSKCLQGYFNVALKDTTLFPVKCAEPSCKTEIGYDWGSMFVASLGEDAILKYDRLWAEKGAGFRPDNVIYCPACNEPLMLDAVRSNKQQCPRCKRPFCLSCKILWHEGFTCEQIQNPDAALVEEAKKQGWAQCARCKSYIVKNLGCNHMTCRCGYHFCYPCALAGKPSELDPSKLYEHFSKNHPLFQSNDIEYDARV